jgi:hypothetical protein
MPIALYAAFDLSQSGLSHGGRLKVIVARDDSDLQNIVTHTVYTVSKCIKYNQKAELHGCKVPDTKESARLPFREDQLTEWNTHTANR